MRRYSKKRSYEWSPAIAYSVGLMASDGCLSKDGRHLDLTSTDIDQLENFMTCIGRLFTISTKVTGRPDGIGKQAYRVQFSDVSYYDFLLNAGLYPNKSRSIGKLNIPDEYWVYFLRGLFDGDGCFYGYFDKRWKSSFMFYMTITSASRIFLEYVCERNEKIIGVSPGSLRASKNVYILSYAKRDTRLIVDKMYNDQKVPHLYRKKVKLEGFIKEGKNVKIANNARVLELVGRLI